MTSKKKLSAFCFTALTTFVFTIAKAQPVISYNNNTFSITTPPIAHPQIPGINPHTNVFFETGTGAFFRFSTNTPDGVPSYQQKTFTKIWNFSPSDNFQPPFVQINRFYDTIRIPPHAASILNFYPVTNSNSNPSQNELAGQFLKITTSVSSPGTGVSTVIPGDTMTVALTYKNTIGYSYSYNKSIIAFFYNSSANPNVFGTIPTGNDAFFNGQTVPALRMHKGESVLTETDISNLPTAIKTQLYKKMNGYTKALYISVPYIASEPERNIFISMAPNLASSYYTGTSSSVKAVLIDYKDLNAGNVTEFSQSFYIDFQSRDPNGILTSPSCLDSFPGPTNKPIKYNVDFQNDGEGVAQNVKVTVFIPEGIPFPSSGLLNITAMVKQQDPLFEKYTVATENFRNTYQFVTTRIHKSGVIHTQRKIIFRMPGIQLPGKINQPANELIRHGNISFTLYTHKNRDSIPNCMYSDISIVFSSLMQNRLRELDPIWDYSLTRKYCKHIPANQPPCSRYSVNGGPETR
jgi:uncharacterized repeat protein (TIGR01451 family)